MVSCCIVAGLGTQSGETVSLAEAEVVKISKTQLQGKLPARIDKETEETEVLLRT